MSYPYTTDEAWRHIRALRHAPPGHAATGDGKSLFTAATKQAEEFFRLSDQARYETKPMLLYYGLNQASRAMAAAVDFPPDIADPAQQDKWHAYGHGLKVDVDSPVTSLGDLEVGDARPHGPKASPRYGSFQKLAQIINSPTLPEPVSMREVWLSTREGAEVPLQDSDDLWCCARVVADNRSWAAATPAEPDDVILEVDVTLRDVPLPSKQDLSAVELGELIRVRYPSLKDFEPRVSGSDGRVSQLVGAFWSRGWVSLDYVPPGQPNLDREGMLVRVGDPTYRNLLNDAFVIPTLTAQTEPMTPLVGWWAILFPLSMLARYQPSGWTRMLDVDTSPDATAIEYMLDEAHRVCVNLIVHGFEEIKSLDMHGVL